MSRIVIKKMRKLLYATLALIASCTSAVSIEMQEKERPGQECVPQDVYSYHYPITWLGLRDNKKYWTKEEC